MKAVVPAAGEGTRLRPLTADCPKGLVEIGSQPLLAHCFDRLVELPVEEIVVVIGYLGEQIRSEFGDAYEGIQITYVAQDQQSGLAHAIQQAEPRIDDSFLVLNGDNVFGSGLQPVIERHQDTGADVTVLVEDGTREAATRTGVVVTGADGEVTGLVEKPADPPTTLITTGCYVLPAEFFSACRAVEPSERGELELPDVITELIDQGSVVRTAQVDGWRVNVNTQSDLTRVAERLGSE